MDIGGILRSKILGIPAPVWLVGGGAVAFFVVPKLTGSKPAAGTTGTAGTTPYRPTTIVNAPPPTTSSSSTPSDTPYVASEWSQSGSGWYWLPSTQGKSFVRGGNSYFWLRDPGAANSYVASGGKTWFFPVPAIPAPFPWGTDTHATSGTYIYGSSSVTQNASTGGGAVGGPARHRPSIGSKSANLWAPHHPLVGQVSKWPHYHRAVGGPATLQSLALRAGLHPGRVAALNSHIDSTRPLRRGQVVRLA